MRILLILLTLISHIAYASDNAGLKITVSSQPIASIVRLIVHLIDHDTTINILTPSGSCPHEYILKPSDFIRVENSNFVIYTSDDFEPFIKPIIKHSQAQIINLSDILDIKSNHNMHIWMSLENVKKSAIIIAHALGLPSKDALQQIDDLNRYKHAQLKNLQSALLLSDSLEYLFEDMPHVKVEKLYIKPGMTSAKDIMVLSTQSANKCILINDKENVESIASKIGHKIVPIAREDWSLDGYKKIIDDIRNTCIQQ